MSTDSFSTHSLSDFNLTKLCAIKTIQTKNRMNEYNLGTAPDNPSMDDINDTTASNKEKTRSDTEQFRRFYGTYHKSVAADPVLHSTLPTSNIHYTHTTNCQNTNPTGIRTIRGFSN